MGNVSSFNAHGTKDGVPRMVYPGQILELPDDPVSHLNKKSERIAVIQAGKDLQTGATIFMTDKENRERLWKGRGFHTQHGFFDYSPTAEGMEPRPVPPHEREAFEERQRDAYYRYKHFNPAVMEFIDQNTVIPNDETDKGWPTQEEPKDEEIFDVSKMSADDVKELLKTCDVKVMEELEGQEKTGKKRPAILTALQVAIKNAYGA